MDNDSHIASQDEIGSQCSTGVIVNTGPRYKVNRINGILHYVEELDFYSSENLQNRNPISRDLTIYMVSGFNNHMERLMQLLAQTVLQAKIIAEELEIAERSIRFEQQALKRTPILMELVHAAGFSGNRTLGLPRYCSQGNSDHISNFLANYYRPERIVVSRVGRDSEAFVKSIDKAFCPCKPNTCREPTTLSLPEPDNSVMIERDLESHHAPMPEFANEVIGPESCGYPDSHFVTACLLHSLLHLCGLRFAIYGRVMYRQCVFVSSFVISSLRSS
ncbi:unnamed protein product [Echinostoma caproni]|uniref:Peptidase M16 N-terminal domain-containing protein n=1 Tax=Echinostoma caproni TaxID=27848 RepID=A0A3P8I343_9TREM|nr:unnamed protein product [Echinostoma caproni]